MDFEYRWHSTVPVTLSHSVQNETQPHKVVRRRVQKFLRAGVTHIRLYTHMKAKAGSAPSWRTSPRPKTAQERIAYLQLCQSHFASCRQLPPAVAELRLGPVVSSGTPSIPSRVYATATPWQVPSNAVFTCACCKKVATVTHESLTISNPMSDWAVLSCTDCLHS